MLGETYCLAFCWYSKAFLVSAEALVVYSTALSTWASILMESCLKLVWLLWPQKVFVTSRGSFNLFTISPWFSTKTAMSMNISCNSLIDDSSFTNISCLEKCINNNDKLLPEETGLNFDHISCGIMGCKNWSLNADFSVWLEENEFYPKRSLSQIKCVLFQQ